MVPLSWEGMVGQRYVEERISKEGRKGGTQERRNAEGKRLLLFLPSCLPAFLIALLLCFTLPELWSPFPGPGLGDSGSGNAEECISEECRQEGKCLFPFLP